MDSYIIALRDDRRNIVVRGGREDDCEIGEGGEGNDRRGHLMFLVACVCTFPG